MQYMVGTRAELEPVWYACDVVAQVEDLTTSSTPTVDPQTILTGVPIRTQL